jgi:hypothetical protein
MNLNRRPPLRYSGLFTAADDAKILPQPLGQRLSNRKIKTARMNFRAVRGFRLMYQPSWRSFSSAFFSGSQ